MKIGNREIIDQGRPYFIADIAANHDGDLERAFRLIELAKEAGADAAKFQNFKAKTIVSKAGFDNLGGQLSHQSAWEKSVYETYEDASVADEWSAKLKEKCDQIGIEYMTSPYDFASVNWADRFVNAYKIGSGDITWLSIIEHIAGKNKPVLLATGASSMKDVERAMDVLQKMKVDVVLMQCNTNYTASPDNFKYINLNVLKSFKEKYPEAVLGLSDHTFGHSTVLGAFALGARVFEKHFTDDNTRKGPDHRFSMNPKTWREMVDATNELYQAMGDGIKRVEENERDTVNIQRRAIYLQKDMKQGEVIEEAFIFPLRPVYEEGILPYEAEKIIGKRLKRDVTADSCLKWGDVEDV